MRFELLSHCTPSLLNKTIILLHVLSTTHDYCTAGSGLTVKLYRSTLWLTIQSEFSAQESCWTDSLGNWKPWFILNTGSHHRQWNCKIPHTVPTVCKTTKWIPRLGMRIITFPSTFSLWLLLRLPLCHCTGANCGSSLWYGHLSAKNNITN